MRILALAPIESTGRAAMAAVRTIGRSGHLTVGVGRAFRKVDLWAPQVVDQLFRVGVSSVPIALFISAFTGVVLSIQASYMLTGGVPKYFVGALVGETMILELGPVLTGLALSGRVGAGIAAEIGTMRVTDQVDALEVLAYDPLAYLVVPRLIAGVIMFPIIVGMATAAGIAAGWLTAMGMLDMTGAQFARGLTLLFESWDVQFAMIKSTSFGLTVTGVGCFFGITTRGGAEGVGIATTRAVVVSSMLILVLDAFWARVLL